MNGSDSREALRHWVEVHPASYSARLLLAWRGVESGGLDKAAMRAIDEEFPNIADGTSGCATASLHGNSAPNFCGEQESARTTTQQIVTLRP